MKIIASRLQCFHWQILRLQGTVPSLRPACQVVEGVTSRDVVDQEGAAGSSVVRPAHCKTHSDTSRGWTFPDTLKLAAHKQICRH